MILAVGLSPAWQQILVFDNLVPGEVNRAAESHWCGSGKVLNVGRAIHSLAPGAGALTICPLGGPAGQAIFHEFQEDRIPLVRMASVANTRVCTTLIERPTGRITELVENAHPIRRDQLFAFEYMVGEAWRKMSTVKCAVFSGSLPALSDGSSTADCYARMMSGLEAPVILDARGPELLAALPHRPLLVKPNREELAATVKRPLETDDDLVRAMREVIDLGAQWVLVTRGGDAAFLASRTEAYRFQPPKVDVVNPIGCGDSVAAGIAVGIADDQPVVEAVRYGLAAAADNATRLLPARLDGASVESLLSRITATPTPASSI